MRSIVCRLYPDLLSVGHDRPATYKLMNFTEAIAWTAIGVSCSAYVLMFLVSAVGYGRRALRPASSRIQSLVQTTQTPTLRVAILKPIAGADDDLAENLRSLAEIDYPSFEILFGVPSENDPGVSIVRQFIRENPQIDATMIVTDSSVALNPKVAQLIALEACTSADVIVVSDSNVRVCDHYLRDITDALTNGNKDLVSHLVIGTSERTIGAALENLQLSGHIAPGVYSAYCVTRSALTIGKSMAMRRQTLSAVGGFQAVASVLAEDHSLARLFSSHGYSVGILTNTVSNINTNCSFIRTIERHSRWAKMRRAMSPLGFIFEPLLSPTTTTLLLGLWLPQDLAWRVVISAIVAQTVMAWLLVRMMRGHWMHWRYLPLELVRNVVLFGCWISALITRKVVWRGHQFQIGQGSMLFRLPTPTSQPKLAELITKKLNPVIALIRRSRAQWGA